MTIQGEINMNTIQELLKHYIESDGYTVYSISQQSGINRTTLQKVLSKQRKISKELYDKLLPFLSLSPIDKEELDQAFLIEQIGMDRFQTHMEIKRILEMSASTLYQTEEAPYDAAVSNIESWSDCMLIQGTYQIVNAIYSVALKNVTTEEQPFLYTFADMSHPYASIFFKPLYHPAFEPLHVKHLIEYQKMVDKLMGLVAEAAVNGETIDLTNYTWTSKGTTYKVIEQNGDTLFVEILNLRAMRK